MPTSHDGQQRAKHLRAWREHQRSLVEGVHCEIRQGLFDRYYLFHPTMCQPYLAWSGSRFVPVTPQGWPTSEVQVCNFANPAEAHAYCRQHKLEPRQEKRP